MARSPRASLAARASRVESTPPENATTTLSSSLSTPSSRSYFAWLIGPSDRQPHQILELGEPLADLGRRQPDEPVEREVLDGEGGHDRTVHQRAPHRRAVHPVLRRQVAHETARERRSEERRVGKECRSRWS